MRKTVQFLMLSLLVCSGLVRAEQKFTVISEKVNGTAMSPDGRYVVGIDPLPVQYGNSNAFGGFRSYLWDAQTGTTTWMTELDMTDFTKSGYFTDVSDSKTIVGYFKDPDYQITVTDWEGAETLPVNVAAVWKDGTRTSLGIGDFQLTDFNNFADGSYATAVSSDGKTVVGFVACGNFATSTPCVWKYNESTSKWDFSRFKLPSGAKGGQVLSVSADGRVAVGMVAYQNRTVSAFWKSTDACTLIEGKKDMISDDTVYNEEYNNGCAYKISPNGEYIAFVFNDVVPGMFFTNEDRYVKIGTYNGVTGLEITAVSDNGDVVGDYKYGNYWTEQYTRPFWYSLNTLRNVDFSYFIYLYAPELDIPYSFIFEDKVTSTLRAVTADGKTIMGNNGTDNWLLQTDASYAMIPENITGLKTKITDLREVTVLWNPVTFAPFGNQLKSYNVYCDGKLVGNVPAEEIGGGGEGGGGIEPLSATPQMASFVHQEVAAGYRKYSVSALYENEDSGKALESPKCEPVEICIAKNFDLPLTDDFDSGSIELNYWTVDNWSENPDQIFWGCGMYLGIGSSFALNSTVSTDGKPYSSAFVSRPLDARNLDHVYVSYVKRYLFVNSEDWPLNADSLSIEVTVDGGDTWTPVKRHLIADEAAGAWSFESIDLSGYVAHQLFQIRLREHGKGLAQVCWYFDLFKVATLAENEAPEDLTGRVEKDNVKLMWKNPIGAYELNYLDSPYGWDVFNLAIGDEGKPFIAASSFEPADLELYRGKYLTSVRAFINHDSNIEDSKDTHASVVIYENGQLIREQEFQVESNEENLVYLDEPFSIDPSKELKVGIKIFDYDERQIPLAYQNTRNFIAGKSDLYSQDNGQTWLKLSDFYANVKDHEYDGYCCWEITANMTDVATVNKDGRLDENLMAYNIYRNGEKLNEQLIYYLQPRFTDNTPLDHACYEVVAYYFDGSISESSVQYCVEKSAIGNASSEEDRVVYPNPASDRINISGSFDKATLLNVNGQPVVETTQNTLTVSALPSGVYFLKISSGEQIEIRKIMVR